MEPKSIMYFCHFSNKYLALIFYCKFVQILVYNITINVIWQLKKADLKPFSVLGVHIVRLGLSFQAKNYSILVVILSQKLNFFWFLIN